MTHFAHARTVIADLREEEALVRYLTHDYIKPATSGQAAAGPGLFSSPVSLSGAAEHGKAVAPLAAPSLIFIRIHRRSAIVRRGSGRAPHTHPLLLLAIAAPVYLLLRLSELTSRLALRLARGQ